MSGSAPQPAPRRAPAESLKDRGPLAHLLHALNQPLTGLQCSLELAVAGPRPVEHYMRTLHEGLELTARMRILVEAIRELADLHASARRPLRYDQKEEDKDKEEEEEEEMEILRFDELVRSTAEDLSPVAASRGVRVLLESRTPLLVRGVRRDLSPLMFRFLESALSLAREGSEMQISASPATDSARLTVSWSAGLLPKHSPFSQQELGLLIAQAGWERAGAQWARSPAETCDTCTVRIPLASPPQIFPEQTLET